MTIEQIQNTLNEIREWEVIMNEAKEHIDEMKNQIKEQMIADNVSQMNVGTYTVRYQEVISNKFDTTAFKKDFMDVYKAYTRTSAYMRLTIS